MSWKTPFVRFNAYLESRGGGMKLLRQMLYRQNPYRIFSVPRSNVDYLGDVGDGTGSSTVTAPLYWVARTFPEAPPMLWRQLESGQEEPVRSHALLRLLQRPNGYFTGPNLWMATTIDYMVDGNAYWLKLRNGAGAVYELWWTPSWLIEPKGDERKFITHYEYKPGLERVKIDPSDVVHLKFAADGDDPRLGRSPLKSVLREVATDDEAASFTAAILRNMGVPGVVISPRVGFGTIPEDQAQTAKVELKAKFTGDQRGDPIVLTGATDIEQFGFSPEQLILRELRRIPEERVTAVLGVPAIVAGLGAGLDRSTFTNMAEAREAAYESGIIPMQKNLSEEIRFQLLGDFEADPFEWRFGFDLSKVRVLQEDLSRQAQRWEGLLREGVATRAEARRAMGLDVDEERDNVFVMPLNVQTIPANDVVINGNGSNGNGTSAREIAREVIRQTALAT